MATHPPALALLIASDVRLYCDGLVELLSRESGVAVAGIAGDWRQLVAQARTLSVDVVLVDVAMHNGLIAVRILRREHPDIPAVALSVTEAVDDIVHVAEAGIAGYVPRDGSADRLVQTIAGVRRGEASCPPHVAAGLLRRLGAVADTRGPASDSHLTAREFEIVCLIADGLSNKEIARDLHIELATVKNHVHNVLAKLGARRRTEAVAWLRGNGRI